MRAHIFLDQLDLLKIAKLVHEKNEQGEYNTDLQRNRIFAVKYENKGITLSIRVTFDSCGYCVDSVQAWATNDKTLEFYFTRGTAQQIENVL